MQGLGEVLDVKLKSFVRTRLLDETSTLLQMFAAFPAIASQPVLERTRILESHDHEVRELTGHHIDMSMVSDHQLSDLFVEQKPIPLLDSAGNTIICQLVDGNVLIR